MKNIIQHIKNKLFTRHYFVSFTARTATNKRIYGNTIVETQYQLTAQDIVDTQRHLRIERGLNSVKVLNFKKIKQ